MAALIVAGALLLLACNEPATPLAPLTMADVAGEYALRGKPTVQGYAVTTFESGMLTLRLDGTMTLRDSLHYCYMNSAGIQCSSFPATSGGTWTVQGDSVHWGSLPDLTGSMRYANGVVTRCYDLIETGDTCDAQLQYDRAP